MRGKLAIGELALMASLVTTAADNVGYGDLRSGKVGSPVTEASWSVPDHVTANPVGAPIAHAGLHVGAVIRSDQADLLLPPRE